MDASPSLGLSVFAADAKEPSTASPAPADPSASPVGGVAPPVSYTNKTDEDFAAAAAQKAAAANDPDTRSTFELWAESDSSAYALAHFIQNAGFTHDPSYTLPPSGTQAWSDLTKGIPDDQLDRLSGAVSAQHAQFLADRIRSDDENEKEWQNGNHSKWGRLALGLVDPANLALMLTGIGEANDASRVVRFLKGGAYAGAANAAFTGALGYLNGTPNAHAIAAAAIQGFALGGALHGILPPGETAAASNDIQNALRTTALNELSDHIDQGTVPEEAVHPAVLAEMRANDAAAAHAEAVESVHAELDSQRDSLVEVASGLTRQNDLRAATKELGDHESALTKAQADLEAVPEPKTAEDHLPDILDRMSNEDAVSYGDSADDPKIVKERTRAAKQEAADAADKSKAQYLADRGNAMDAVDNAEDRAVRQRAIVQRMRDAEQAQKELRDHDTAVEKAQGDPHKLVQVIRDDATRAKLSEALKPPEELPNEAQASEVPVESPSGAGAHSMGAAEASDTMSPAVELDPAAVKVTKDVPQSSRASEALNRGPFQTFSSVLRGHANAIVRSRLGRMFGEAVAARPVTIETTDAAGNVTRTSYQPSATVGASDHVNRLSSAWHAQAAVINMVHKAEWMREEGISGLFKNWDRDVESEWSTGVGKAIRGGETTSKAMKEAAHKYSKLYRDILKEAKTAGVKGMDDVTENEHYLPRIFNFKKIQQMHSLLGDTGMKKFLGDAMEKGMADSGIDRPTIDKIAAAYLHRTQRLALGIDNQMMNGIKLDDLEFVGRMLTEDGGLDASEVSDALASLKDRMEARGSSPGTVKFAKNRVEFDENHTITADGQQVSISDMWNNDARQVTGRYIRTMAGATGLARVGIQGEEDFNRSIAEAVSSLKDSGAKDADIANVKAYAQGGYKLLMGRPLDNDSLGLMQRLGMLARDWAYSRSMNQAGFSIANNLIRPWTNGYARYTSKYIPELASMFSRDGETGELNNELSRELERFTGMGADSVGMEIYNHFESDSLVGDALNYAGHKLKVAGRVTSHISGMTPGLVMGQRLMANGIIDRLVRFANGEADIPIKRLAIMGLDDPMMARIKGQLKSFAPEALSSTGAIRTVNWANWTDLEARDAMLSAVFRETRILIHGEDVASTGLWMNKGIGKLAVQLRRFPMMALSKQLARGLHMQDMDTVMDLLATSVVGAASYAAQTKLRSIGMDDKDKEAFLAKNLNMGRAFAAGLQRNPYSSMAPQVLDTIVNNTYGSPLFNARGSGLSTGLLDGVPIVDALSKLNTAISEPVQATLQSNKRFTQKGWRALTSVAPLGNSFPMVWLTNAMASEFPKSQLPQQGGGNSDGLIASGVNRLTQ